MPWLLEKGGVQKVQQKRNFTDQLWVVGDWRAGNMSSLPQKNRILVR